MENILIFFALYSITLLFFLWARAPRRIEMECRKCNKIQKKHVGSYCTCGAYLSWTDRISDSRKMILNLEHLGLIKRVKFDESSNKEE